MDAKILCLGTLSRGDASGYEIKKAFEEGPLGHIHEASFGAIYPALTELERQGLVTGREMAQEKRPDKKVFALTEDGLKAFEEGPLGHIHEASFGAIYPALTELERQGLVTGREMAQEKRPDKKVFALTEEGLKALHLALLNPPARDKTRSDFLFIVFLGHLVEASRLAELIDNRIAWYQDCLSRMAACDLSASPPGESFVHGLGLAVYTAARDYLVAHRADLLDAVAAQDRLVAE